MKLRLAIRSYKMIIQGKNKRKDFCFTTFSSTFQKYTNWSHNIYKIQISMRILKIQITRFSNFLRKILSVKAISTSTGFGNNAFLHQVLEQQHYDCNK